LGCVPWKRRRLGAAGDVVKLLNRLGLQKNTTMGLVTMDLPAPRCSVGSTGREDQRDADSAIKISRIPLAHSPYLEYAHIKKNI